MSESLPDTVVWTRGLRKTFHMKGREVEAVRGVDLAVHAGEIFGLLGPNGAGKTTVLRMLATLLAIDTGEALVAGIDVARRPAAVRRRIGYVGQRGGADLPATGWENLVLQGQLYGASRDAAAERARELAEAFGLTSFADRPARTYSGGQRRRLELALGILHRPAVLFLDEPTLGLDPQNRAHLWDQLRELRDGGTTIFLTTHYLDEADALSDRIAIIDHGQVVASGTPHALKQQLAGAAVTIRPRPGTPATDELFAVLVGQPFVCDARRDGETIYLNVADGARALPVVVDLLRERAVGFEAISLTEPSLDDVFLRQTGRTLRDAGAEPQEVPA